MRIISTTDLSREGNDCYINEEVSLVEQFGIYSVINFYKVTGWSKREDVSVFKYTKDFDEAKDAYIYYGGKYEEYGYEDLPL